MLEAETHLWYVRHAESEGNVDAEIYKAKSDNALRLTPKGIRQAKRAGRFLTDYLQDLQKQDRLNGKIKVWYSPYARARETACYILYPMGKVFDHSPTGILSYQEGSSLFEQRRGLSDGLTKEQYVERHPWEARNYDRHSDNCGTPYAIAPLGESRMDIVNRIESFFLRIGKDRDRHDVRNVIVIAHGTTLRSMVKRAMDYSPEWLAAEMNPGQCWIRHTHGRWQTGYFDEGYIYAPPKNLEERPEAAPMRVKSYLRNPRATQMELKGAENIFALKSMARSAIVPPGVNPIDPFAPIDRPRKIAPRKPLTPVT